MLSKKNVITKFMVACALPVALSACGKGSNTDPVANMKEAAKDSELQEKIFKGECSVKLLEALVTGIRTGGDTAIKSAREQYQFVGANVNHVTNLYTTTDCSGSESLIFREEGSFKIDDKQQTADHGKFIDLEMKNLTVEVVNQDGAKVAQASKLCGMQDWGVQNKKDVTAAAAHLSCYRQPVPVNDANIYHVEGKTLVFGQKSVRNNQRPAGLDLETKYIAD